MAKTYTISGFSVSTVKINNNSYSCLYADFNADSLLVSGNTYAISGSFRTNINTTSIYAYIGIVNSNINTATNYSSVANFFGGSDNNNYQQISISSSTTYTFSTSITSKKCKDIPYNGKYRLLIIIGSSSHIFSNPSNVNITITKQSRTVNLHIKSPYNISNTYITLPGGTQTNYSGSSVSLTNINLSNYSDNDNLIITYNYNSPVPDDVHVNSTTGTSSTSYGNYYISSANPNKTINISGNTVTLYIPFQYLFGMGLSIADNGNFANGNWGIVFLHNIVKPGLTKINRTYNSSLQYGYTGTLKSAETLSGTSSAKDAGTYTYTTTTNTSIGYYYKLPYNFTNYTGISGLESNCYRISNTWTIDKAEVSLINETTLYNRTYNGSDQKIADVSSTYISGTTIYLGAKLNNSSDFYFDSSEESYVVSNTISKKDAGTYYVWGKVPSGSVGYKSNNYRLKEGLGPIFIGTATITPKDDPMTFSVGTKSVYCTSSAMVASSTDSAKTVTIDAAASNIGIVTYSITGRPNTNWTLSDRTLTIPAGTAAGDYSVTIKASDAAGSNYTNTEKSSTFTVKVVAVYVTRVQATISSGNANVSYSTTSIPAGGGIITPIMSGAAIYTLSNGTTKTDSTSYPFGSGNGTSSYKRTFSEVSDALDIGFVSSNGKVTIQSRGRNTGESSTYKIGVNLHVVYTHPSSLGGGTIPNPSNTTTDDRYDEITFNIGANKVEEISLTLGSPAVLKSENSGDGHTTAEHYDLVYGSTCTPTVTAIYTSGSSNNVTLGGATIESSDTTVATVLK